MEEMANPAVPEVPQPAADGGRFRDLLDRLPQSVFETDLQGRFTYANQGGLTAFGYSLE